MCMEDQDQQVTCAGKIKTSKLHVGKIKTSKLHVGKIKTTKLHVGKIRTSKLHVHGRSRPVSYMCMEDQDQ